MKVLIEISEELYKQIKEENEVGLNLSNPIDALVASVKNGTPLPKGHGRLIDADAVLEASIGNIYKDIDIAETIIEADKES